MYTYIREKMVFVNNKSRCVAWKIDIEDETILMAKAVGGLVVGEMFCSTFHFILLASSLVLLLICRLYEKHQKSMIILEQV